MTHFGEQNRVIFRDFDPNTATPTFFGHTNAWIDMKNYHRITCIAVRTVGTGSIVAASIHASAAVAGTSSSAVTTATTASVTGLLSDAVATNTSGSPGAGMFVLEATADEIAATVSGGRYVATNIKQTTATDEFGLIWILSEPRYSEAGLTVTSNSI